MADQQRIHPVDVESQPTAPLVPSHSWRSDKGDPIERAPSYSRRSDGPIGQAPPLRRTIPISHSKPPKRRGCCCRCLCWTICLLFLLIILIAATVGILYLVFQPKLPKYSIDRLAITSFQLNADMSVSAQFNVTITARNPNKHIGIYYEDGSELSVWYTNTSLCDGTLPNFYQGHQNTTVLDIVLTGQTQSGSGLMSSILQEQQQTGSVPLDVKANVPVRVKFGSLKLKKVKFLVRCRLVVNQVSANNQISIRSSSCKFKLRL
ncbi:late embryogenesis abundant (LEA) hydroxyproline-rich glycoprotein family [Tasmannia lanceolata]|uniref:late embryogenesis abundant (LEA) hydroxyproline-rich glycoprotein family n=1 Tax=Tasmannia lanceolata TaxID=3420 RepID=UPI004063AB74